MTDPAAQPAPDSKMPKKRRQWRARAELAQLAGKVTCLVCRESFPRLTVRHLATHGWTLELYTRRFGPLPAFIPLNRRKAAAARAILAVDAGLLPSSLPPPRPHALAAVPDTLALDAERHGLLAGGELSRVVGERLVGDPHFTARLADEVADAVFAGPLRDKLRLGLVSILSQRLELHGTAVAQLKRVAAELAQPWRLEAGGEGGSATSTKDLVAMLQGALTEVRHGEELVMKAVKSALEEQRSRLASGHADSPLDGVRFSGAAERVPMPTGISGAERETIRTLFGMLKKGVEARRAIVESDAAKPAGIVVQDRPPEQPTVPTPSNGATDERSAAAGNFD